jgi:hypothetical protein
MAAGPSEVTNCALRQRWRVLSSTPRLASLEGRRECIERLSFSTNSREEQIAELGSVLIEYRQYMLYSLLRGANLECTLTDVAPARSPAIMRYDEHILTEDRSGLVVDGTRSVIRAASGVPEPHGVRNDEYAGANATDVRISHDMGHRMGQIIRERVEDHFG